MNSVWPGRIRSNSISIGSLTFKMSSASPQTSSWPATIVAPAAAYSSSVIEEPSPAPAWTRTW